MRYVSCRDNQGGVAEESACAHLPKPPAREVCSVVACGQWKVLEWTVVRKPPVIIICRVVCDPVVTHYLKITMFSGCTYIYINSPSVVEFQISGNF